MQVEFALVPSKTSIVKTEKTTLAGIFFSVATSGYKIGRKWAKVQVDDLVIEYCIGTMPLVTETRICIPRSGVFQTKTDHESKLLTRLEPKLKAGLKLLGQMLIDKEPVITHAENLLTDELVTNTSKIWYQFFPESVQVVETPKLDPPYIYFMCPAHAPETGTQGTSTAIGKLVVCIDKKLGPGYHAERGLFVAHVMGEIRQGVAELLEHHGETTITAAFQDLAKRLLALPKPKELQTWSATNVIQLSE